MSREMDIHCAKVYLTEAKRRRSGTFHAVLLKWAAKCRKRAFDYVSENKIQQLELFV